MQTAVAFIGLGVMGYPMAGHLARAGYPTTVFNRTASRAGAWLAAYGDTECAHVAETPVAAARGAGLVFVCVGDDRDVEEVICGDDGVFAGLGRGAVLVDHTTASAALARELAAMAEGQGGGFLDAPVSGGQAGAEQGTLTVMAGGDERHFATARPAIECYARSVRLLGPAGSGQLAKMVNQICIAGIVQGLAEGLTLARAAGLDAAAVIEVISKGAAQSWQMDNRARTMIDDEFDFGFAVKWMRKDLKICLEESRGLGISLPLTALVDQFYADVEAMGGARWDTSSLIRRLGRP